MVLMAGEKHRERLTRDGLIHPGRHAVVGYPKFDAADAIRVIPPGALDNGRPTVLLQPALLQPRLPGGLGEPLIAAFAAQDRYNLIVAPHVRMLDGKARKAKWRALTQAYADCPHILIDDGSTAPST